MYGVEDRVLGVGCDPERSDGVGGRVLDVEDDLE